MLLELLLLLFSKLELSVSSVSAQRSLSLFRRSTLILTKTP